MVGIASFYSLILMYNLKILSLSLNKITEIKKEWRKMLENDKKHRRDQIS